MRHRAIPLAGLVLALGLAACASGTGGSGSAEGSPPASGRPDGSPSPAQGAGGTAGAPSPTAFVRPNLTAAGLGPYVVGARLDALRTSGLLVDVRSTPACPGFSTAQGTAAYGRPALVFYQGALQYLSITDPAVRTADGVRVGQTDAQVRARYRDVMDLNTGDSGQALFVTQGQNALLFRLDTNSLVSSIEAGLADPVQFRFTEGEGC